MAAMNTTTMAGHCLHQLEILRQQGTKVQCVVTSPPYWGLRVYDVEADWPDVRYVPMPGLDPIDVPAWHGELGQEPTLNGYIAHMVLVARAIKHVLADDGVFWLNIGDSMFGSWGNYKGHTRGEGKQRERKRPAMVTHKGAESMQEAVPIAKRDGHGLKPQEICAIPWRLGLAFQADGWHLKQEIIWSKPNPQPESMKTRCTRAHEYLLMLAKGPDHYFDADAIRERAVKTGTEKHLRGGKSERAGNRVGLEKTKATGTRNKRSVWEVALVENRFEHYATYPPKLIVPCILSSSRPGDTVLDPFGGTFTTAQVAVELGRNAIMVEGDGDSVALGHTRMAGVTPSLWTTTTNEALHTQPDFELPAAAETTTP
jgi:DNA modification methylase